MMPMYESSEVISLSAHSAAVGKLEQTINQQAAELAATRAEIEVERMRLAACGVVAMSNTPESAAKAREMLPEYRSGSMEDVIRALDSEMALREQLAAEQAKNVELRKTLTGILNADWTKWEELASLEEFVRWTKSRANHALSAPSDTSALESMIAKAGEKMKEKCASASQAVIDSGAYDGHQQYAAASCRDAIRALPGVTLEDLK